MKQLEVTILGQSYLLGCPEGGEIALLEAVGNVDREMSAIRDGGKVKARERIAVLAALNLAYALAGRPPARVAQTSGAGAPASSETQVVNAGAVDVDALISRLDQALGADGQLL
jgi:cell division protein ZapA